MRASMAVFVISFAWAWAGCMNEPTAPTNGQQPAPHPQAAENGANAPGNGDSETARKADFAWAVARAYGVEKFGEIDRLAFTFNLKSGEREVKRAWEWEPKTDRVKFVGQAPGATADADAITVSYSRTDISTVADAAEREKLASIDRLFVNDKYWFLFPLMMVWDDSRIADAGAKPLPMGDGTARQLIVRYPGEGGYTPGDVYELFADETTQRLVQWVFRRGGSENGRPATWANHQRLGPLVVCTDHKNADGSFHLWFDNLAVTLAGEAFPKAAEPLGNGAGNGAGD